MKKILLIGFFTLFVLFRNVAQPMLILTNYTYSDSQKTIGEIKVNDGTLILKSSKLSDSVEGLFSITKDNKLVIRNDHNEWGKPFYDLAIECSTSAGELRETFRIVKDEFNHNKVIAHRGAWKNSGAAQNSIGSLREAIRLGCFGTEFDVHLAADSIPVVIHDYTIQGIDVEMVSSNELARIRLPNGEPVPTLEAYLREGMRQNQTRLILEIKTSRLGKKRSLALTEKVVTRVRSLKAQGWVDYIAFDYDVCKTVKALDPYARVAYLNGDKTPRQLASDQLFGLDYNLNILKKNEDWLREARQEKLTINVWTVNDQPSMEWFLAKNVDFITTDQPELLLRIAK